MGKLPVNKLCCALNPCYICEACGFKECSDHWDERKWQTGWEKFHFEPPYDDAESVCRVTHKKLKVVETANITLYKLL